MYFILIVAILAACSSADDNIPDSPVHAVTMEQTTLGLSVGGSQQLVATITPVNVKATQTWTSSSVGIASVSKDGIVTGVSAGVARITFRADDKTAVCTVKVGNTPATDIVVPDRMELTIGDAEVAVAYVLPETSVTTIKWSSSNDMIVSVAHDGTLKAWRTGNVIITATADDVEKSFPVVVVVPPPTAITLNKTTHTMKVGETVTLTATLTPTGATSKITWSTDNLIASGVSSTGKVTAYGAGTATITATTANGLKASCVITITQDAPPPPVPTITFAHAAAVQFIDQPFDPTETPLFSMAIVYMWQSGMTFTGNGFTGDGYAAELWMFIPRGAQAIADGTYSFKGISEVNPVIDMSGNCLAGVFAAQKTSYSWLLESYQGKLYIAAPMKNLSSLKFATTAGVTTLSGTFDVWASSQDPGPWFEDEDGNAIDEIVADGSFTMQYPSPARSAKMDYKPLSKSLRTNAVFKR